MTLKFVGWPWQTIGHIFYATSSFVNHFKAIGEFKLEWQPGNAQFRSKSAIFVPCDLEISQMTLKNNRALLLCTFKIWASFHSHLWIRTGVTVWKIPILGQNIFFLAPWPWNLTGNIENNRAPFLCYFNLYASFHSHLWFQTGDTVRKRTIWVEIDDFLAAWPWNLTDDLEMNRAPLLNNIKLCVSFHHHMRNQTGVMVPKQLIWGLTSVTLTFDLWPWTFA